MNNNYYSIISNRLKLIVENINMSNPNDVAYVYSGYAPISIRLVEKAMSLPFHQDTDEEYGKVYEGWGTRHEELLDKVLAGGPIFRTRQKIKKRIN